MVVGNGGHTGKVGREFTVRLLGSELGISLKGRGSIGGCRETSVEVMSDVK